MSLMLFLLPKNKHNFTKKLKITNTGFCVITNKPPLNQCHAFMSHTLTSPLLYPSCDSIYFHVPIVYLLLDYDLISLLSLNFCTSILIQIITYLKLSARSSSSSFTSCFSFPGSPSLWAPSTSLHIRVMHVLIYNTKVSLRAHLHSSLSYRMLSYCI